MTGGPFRDKKSCASVIMQRGWMLWNKKFLCICHQVMRADPIKPIFLCTCHHVTTVYLLGTENSCAPVITRQGWMLFNKKFLWTCHYVMRMDVVEQKILGHLSSRDEGGCRGTKNSCGPDIRWWGCMSWEQNVLVYRSSGDEGGPSWTKNLVDLSSCNDGVPSIGNKNFLRTCHHAMRVDVVEKNSCVLGTRNLYGPVIRRIRECKSLICASLFTSICKCFCSISPNVSYIHIYKFSLFYLQFKINMYKM